MATQQKTDEETRTSQNRNQESRSNQNREQGTRGTQEAQNQGERSLQRQQAGAYAPFALGPFALIRRLQEDIDRVFGLAGRGQTSMAQSTRGSSMPSTQGVWTPPVETFQRNDEFVVRVDLPGLSADDVVIEVGEDALTIRGERRYEHEEERDGVY